MREIEYLTGELVHNMYDREMLKLASDIHVSHVNKTNEEILEDAPHDLDKEKIKEMLSYLIEAGFLGELNGKYFKKDDRDMSYYLVEKFVK